MAVAILNRLLLLGGGGRAFVSLTGLSVGEDKAHMPPTYHTFLKGLFFPLFSPFSWLKILTGVCLCCPEAKNDKGRRKYHCLGVPGAQNQLNLPAMDRVDMIHKIISFFALTDIKTFKMQLWILNSRWEGRSTV